MIKSLFKLDDKILGNKPMYALWMCMMATILSVFSVDDTTGPSRDFSVFAIGTACVYPCAHILNSIYGDRLTSTWKLIATSFQQYLFWILLTYFQPSKVLGSHPIGVMNWVWIWITIPFTCDMLAKTYWVLFNEDEHQQYLKDNTKNQNNNVQVSA